MCIRDSYFNTNWAEQDPEDFWKAICVTSRNLIDKARIDPGDICLLYTSLGTGTSALAAESVPASAPSTGISVQLDGRNLSFPDAAPEARDGRTFLPVRTVFEAMGAEVSYSPAAQTITAVRDGTTVTMALGGTTATVERSGVTTHIPMDAAPYAHDNRTYVPVRFAAQAFGCAVGLSLIHISISSSTPSLSSA